MAKEQVIPVPTPETKHFWDGTKQEELRLQKCNSCETNYFPPRPFCPECSSTDVEVFKASGKGKIHTFIISNFRSPGFKTPYSIAVIELDEGPRMLSNIVEVEQSAEAISMEMPVEAVYEPVNDDVSLVKFRPVVGA